MEFRATGRLTIRTPLPDFSPANLEQVALVGGVEAVRVMRLRARAGRDLGGSPFKPFSAEYARRRRLSGRDTMPRLYLTGQLMGGLQVINVTGGTATVGWGAKSDTVSRFRRIRTKSGARSQRKARRLVAGGPTALQWRLEKTPETIPAALKAAYAEKQGRTVLGIAQGDEARRVGAAIRREIRRLTRG